MLAATARLADVVTFNIPLGRPGAIGEIGIAQAVTREFEQRVETVRESANARRAGRSSITSTFTPSTSDPAGATMPNGQQATSDWTLTITSTSRTCSPAMPSASPTRCVHGTPAYGIGYVSVPGQHVDSFAPVLAVLAG